MQLAFFRPHARHEDRSRKSALPRPRAHLLVSFVLAMGIGVATSAIANAMTCLQPHDVWTLSLESIDVEGDGVAELQDYVWPSELELNSYFALKLSSSELSLELEPAP